jgi:hypothetical protein
VSGPIVPVTSDRQDWPRLVANAVNSQRSRIDELEASGGGVTSPLYVVAFDGGDASATGASLVLGVDFGGSNFADGGTA